jgi:ABC-type dipeptide/oligopeptide/nickel transport system permease component
MTLPRFLLWRLLGALAFVVVVSSTALVLIRLSPGDAATELKLTVADEAAIAETRARLGLDRPVLAQVGTWIAGLARFDLGTSSHFNRPVAGLVADRVGNTALLAGLALVLATLIGIPLGVVTGSARRRGGAGLISLASVMLVACPPILLSLGLLYLSVSMGGWLPVSGHIALPLVALSLPMAAVIERLQSRASAEALSQPSVMAAAARGVPWSRIVWVHALRPSLGPVLGVYGIIIATLFSGSVAVETVSSWPGLGRLMVDGLLSRDVFLVAGCALAGAMLIALGNLVADLLRVVTDPRIREVV